MDGWRMVGRKKKVSKKKKKEGRFDSAAIAAMHQPSGEETVDGEQRVGEGGAEGWREGGEEDTEGR